jgi:hypothetical protein
MTLPTKAAPSTDVNVRINQYVSLRDKIKALDQAHKEKMAPFREMLDTLGGVLLDHLKNISADSVATPSGTVYKTVKNSASIADGKAFWDYVHTNEEWDLIDKKANVNAVQDFIEQHNAPPPGINFSSMITVGVRRK